MVNLQNKVTTYDVTTEYNNMTFTGKMEVDENNTLKSINGTFEEDGIRIGGLFYDVFEDGINKNLTDFSYEKEDDLNVFVSTLLAECRESIINNA